MTQGREQQLGLNLCLTSCSRRVVVVSRRSDATNSSADGQSGWQHVEIERAGEAHIEKLLVAHIAQAHCSHCDSEA